MDERLDIDEPAAGGSKLRLSPMADAGRRGSRTPDDPHLLDYVKVIYRRRWTVLAVFLVVAISTIVWTFTATPVYQARVKLLIEADSPNVVNFTEVIEQNQGRADYYQTQYNLLQSRSLARQTLSSLALLNDPQFRAAQRTQSGGLRSLFGSVRRLVSRRPAATPGVRPDETAAEASSIDALLGNISVEPVRHSRIVDLKLKSTDPDIALKVVNAHAQNYINQNMEFRFMSSKEAADWLTEQLADQRKQVEAAELALQRYREVNDAISLEDRENIVVQKLTDLNAAVTRAKTERIQKEALYTQLRSIQSDRAALDTFPAILSNSFIQAQKAELAAFQRQLAEQSERLGDKHPIINGLRTSIQTAEAKLQGEIGKVVQSVRNEFLAAQAQEQSLVAALEAQKRDALAMNEKGIQYGVLSRELDSSRQIYNSLLQRAKETGVSTELRTSNVRIVDPAERPRGPISPRTDFNVLMGLLGGLMLGIGVAMFFEYLDDRIKTPEQLRSQLGLASLGMLPAISPKALDGKAVLLSSGVPVSFSEAFRSIRTSLLFSVAESESRTISVTSTGPGEGKTVVSTNLAVSLAQAGQKVLLIDADMRRPRVHATFDQRQAPGLSELIIGSVKASESVIKSSTPGLWLLPAGTTPPNPAELLASRKFHEFVQSASTHFDWVIVDTPPVMSVTDACIVANLVRKVVFVVGADMTSHHLARAALDMLDSAKAGFAGAVLNRVNLEQHPYYYSQYYRRDYGTYYSTPQAS